MRVLLVFSPDSPEHLELTSRLGAELRADGHSCRAEPPVGTSGSDLVRWCVQEVAAADAILVINSDGLRTRTADMETASGKRILWYSCVLQELLRAGPSVSAQIVVIDVEGGATTTPPLGLAYSARYRYPEERGSLRESLGPVAGEQAGGSPSIPPGAGSTGRAAPAAHSPARLPTPMRDILRYLRGVDDVYRQSPVADSYVRPSGESGDGAQIPDALAHVKNALSAPGAFVLVLGDYGSGKTAFSFTLMRELALDFLAGAAPVPPLPLFLSLSFARNAPSLTRALSLFVARYGVVLTEDALWTLLSSTPSSVLVLDGLDEVVARVRRRDLPPILAQLAELRTLPGVRVLLTCRSTFFRDNVDEAEVPATSRLVLAPFSDAQIDQYLSRGEPETHPRVRSLLEAHPRLLELCRTPIHLFLAQSFMADREPGEEFAAIDLYESFIAKNLAVNTAANPQWSSRERRAFLANLAVRIFEQQTFELSLDELADLLEQELPGRSAAQLQELCAEIANTGLFIRVGDRFRFIHPSFLEYFAAETLVDELYRGDVTRWGRRPLYAEVFDFLIQLIRRRGLEALPFDAVVAATSPNVPSNFLATMYRWPTPQVRPYFEHFLVHGTTGLVRCVASQGVGQYLDPTVAPGLIAAVAREANTVVRATEARLLERLREHIADAAVRAKVDAVCAEVDASPVSADDAEEILRTKTQDFALIAYRKALRLGDLRPSSTIAAIYLLAAIGDEDSSGDLVRIASASAIPAIRAAYRHAQRLMPLPALDESG